MNITKIAKNGWVEISTTVSVEAYAKLKKMMTENGFRTDAEFFRHKIREVINETVN